MNWRVGVGHFETTPTMRKYMDSVLDSGRLSYGPMSKKLEERFAKMHGCDYGVLSSSGTSSLQVALQAMKEYYDWPDGAEVIVPAVTFVATINIVLHNNLTPVLVDVDPHTYNMDPQAAQDAITSETVCMIPVHLFGQPANMQKIYRHVPTRIRFLEDSCECVLATHHGEKVGSLGDVGCFSFYMAHILTAGVGGIATTRNKDLADIMRSLVNHGRQIKSGGDIDIKASDQVRRGRFLFERIGHSHRVTEMESALALAQLQKLKTHIAARQDNAGLLTKGLSKWTWNASQGSGYRLQLPRIEQGNTHSFMMYPIIYAGAGQAGRDKWDLCAWLEDHGIETREMLPLTNQPVYKDLFTEDDYPIAKTINEQGLYVGIHQGISIEDLDYMIEVFDEYFRNHAGDKG